MVITPRATRWPSAWQMYVECKRLGQLAVEVVNVSTSGMQCSWSKDIPVKVGDQIRFRVLGELIYGRVVRLTDVGGALAFRTQISERHLHTLRQYRALVSDAAPRKAG